MSDDDEDYASFGTPLEPLEEDVVQAKKAPRLEEQVVLDKQGRRRFHGAFSGGFSAGYFNSVGTKEGWTPQTFVSSRGERAKNKKFQPYDYMDDEDLGEHGIAPQRIRATSSYDSVGDKKRKRVFDPDGPIPGVPVLEEILRPSRETMGMKLLRHLGWKPGQGIGPRVSHKHKKNSRNKVKGCRGPPGSKDSSDDSDHDMGNMDDYMPDVTFAPDDVDTLDLSSPKSDQFGLGYKPLDRTSVLGHINLFDPNPLSITDKKKKLLVKGQAFGVGAFEDEDEDIYSTEDMSNYDFSGDDFNKNKSGKEGDKYHQAIMDLSDRVEGFKLSSQPLQTLKNYPLPKIPKDFMPHHKPRRLRFERRESDIRGLGRHDLSQQQRAEMLKERTKTKIEVRSGMKQEPKEILASQSKQAEVEADAERQKLFDEFKSSGSKPISEFKPFARDPEKQRRYELYIRMKAAGHKDRFHLALPRSMTEWEKERETREFYRAAGLFQPLTSTMSSRFVTASLDEKVPLLKDGLNVDIPKVVELAKIESETDALGGNIKDDRIKAAKMKMFGKLTQYTDDWYPDNLVCRRFNIPNPYPGSRIVGVPKGRREKFSLFNSLNAPIEDTAGLQSGKEKEDEQRNQNEEDELSEEGSTEDQELDESKYNYGLKVPVDGPPTMDLFKAIFQDSDSDSDSDDSDKEENNKEKSNTQHQRYNKAGSDKKNIDKNVDDFLLSMRNNVNTSEVSVNEHRHTEELNKANINNSKSDCGDSKLDKAHKGPRVSRFDMSERPKLDNSQNNPKHVFVPRKKDPPPEEKKDPPPEEKKDPPPEEKKDPPPDEIEEPTSTTPAPAKGIFANIDFEEINSYRDYQPQKDDSNNSKSKENESDSSIDSDDEYGPSIPVHLKGRNQMIIEPKMPVVPKVGENKVDKKWKEKHREKKKHKHKEKHKHKKEKKKKRRSSISSDSSEDSSDSPQVITEIIQKHKHKKEKKKKKHKDPKNKKHSKKTKKKRSSSLSHSSEDSVINLSD